MKEIEEASKILEVDGYKLTISKPQKVYWPREGFTKMDLLNYYEEMSGYLLPHLLNRPLSLHYFPRGIEDFSFYKRNFDDEKPQINLFTTETYTEKSQDKRIEILVIKSAAGIIYFASKGGIEFHTWSAKVPNYEYPDIAIFDLDINNISNFPTVLKVAQLLNSYLNSINIHSFAKTSGGTGLHVYVPIVPQYSYETIRSWIQTISMKLGLKYPNLITFPKDGSKTHVSDKVSIDHMQNVISRNTIAPYSVRAYSKAPVSTPLTWKEVEAGDFLPEDFNIKTVPERVGKIGDLFLDVLKHKQVLPATTL